MIKIFYGDDRLKIQSEVTRFLGKDYENIEGETLLFSDMDSLFMGASLFANVRCILVKDLSENKKAWQKLTEYADSEHKIVVWESKIDKRSVAYKELIKKKIEIKEFKLAEMIEKKLIFDIFDIAWKGDGAQALMLCEKIEKSNDPYMFFGLIISQALKKIEFNGGKKAKLVVKLLADYDIKIKSTGFEPWILIKSCLLKLSSL